MRQPSASKNKVKITQLELYLLNFIICFANIMRVIIHLLGTQNFLKN